MGPREPSADETLEADIERLEEELLGIDDELTSLRRKIAVEQEVLENQIAKAEAFRDALTAEGRAGEGFAKMMILRQSEKLAPLLAREKALLNRRSQLQQLLGVLRQRRP